MCSAWESGEYKGFEAGKSFAVPREQKWQSHESRGALLHILQKPASLWCAETLGRLLFPV